MNRFELDDEDMYGEDGYEYMRREDHDEEMECFKENARIFFKDLMTAMLKKDDIAIADAMDELAEHIGVHI